MMRRSFVLCAVACVLATFAPASASSSAPSIVAGPVTITPPDQPFFMEPFLLATDAGLIVATQAKPESRRVGWTCRSGDGSAWSCAPVPQPETLSDFADPWLVDSRGSACPAYDGITLISLQGNLNGDGRYLEPSAYTSKDGGRTWSGPEVIPSNVPIGDGTKGLYDGNLYAAWRDFAFAGGSYVSKLGTPADPCAWNEPTLMPDGHDHVRLADGDTPGGFAFRGAVGTTLLTAEQYGANGLPARPPGMIAATEPLFVLTQLCDSAAAHCFAAYDLGRTLVKGDGDTYYAVWLDRPDGGAADREHTVTRFSESHDGGFTWSAPSVIAGPGADTSTPGSASWMPELSFDRQTHRLVFASVERDDPDQREAGVRVRVLGADGWSAPVQAGTTLTWTSTGTNRHLGDYFGLEAVDGAIHVVWQNVTDEAGLARLDYVRMREGM